MAQASIDLQQMLEVNVSDIRSTRLCPMDAIIFCHPTSLEYAGWGASRVIRITIGTIISFNLVGKTDPRIVAAIAIIASYAEDAYHGIR
jgi:hypothetical protein